ncbi:hypothetical protein ACQVP2_27355 [Methylobacterium aquaticum]
MDLFQIERDHHGRVTRFEIGFGVWVLALALVSAVAAWIAS